MKYSSDTMLKDYIVSLLDYAFSIKSKIFFCVKDKTITFVGMFDEYNTYSIQYGNLNNQQCYSFMNKIPLDKDEVYHIDIDDDENVYVQINDEVFNTNKENFPTIADKFIYFAQAYGVNAISYFALNCDAEQLTVNPTNNTISFNTLHCNGKSELTDVKAEEPASIYHYNPAIVYDATYISPNDRYTLSLSRKGLLKLESDYTILVAPMV